MSDRDTSLAGRGPRGWTPSDSRLIEEVSERLMEDRLLDASQIEVSADGGIVTLAGEVPGASDVAHAEMLVRRTPGVREVHNRLSFRPGARAVDKPPREESRGLQGRWGRWVPPFAT
jgi:osmotically-inducible protein OsmY